MSGALTAAIPAPYTVAPVRGPLAHVRHVQSTRSSSLYALVALAMACSYIFESPLRYVLLLAHVPSLIYLRDLAAFALIGLAVFAWLTGERRLFPVVVALYALFLHLLIGVFVLPGVIQPLLGLKVFFTFLFGMAAASAIARHGRTASGSSSSVPPWKRSVTIATSGPGMAMTHGICGCALRSPRGENIIAQPDICAARERRSRCQNRSCWSPVDWYFTAAGWRA